jgi:hypothetical protein
MFVPGGVPGTLVKIPSSTSKSIKFAHLNESASRMINFVH